MLYSIKNVEDLQKLNELVSLQNQKCDYKIDLVNRIIMRIQKNYLNQ